MNFPTGAVNGGLIKEGALASIAAPLTVELKEDTLLPFLLPQGGEVRFDRRMEFLESFDSTRHLDRRTRRNASSNGRLSPKARTG